jgi:hypothetical protein
MDICTKYILGFTAFLVTGARAAEAHPPPAYPGLQIITQVKGRQMMAGPALAFNQPGLERDLPDYLASLEKRVGVARSAEPRPPELAKPEHLLEEDRSFLQQKTGVRHTLPNLTFTDTLTPI